MNLADHLFASLEAHGITACFGLPGVHALGLWDSLSRSSIKYLGFRHEQAAAHAADGYGRATGLPGVVLSSTGPGALNMLSAIAEAKVSSSPLLAIVSAIPSGYLGKKKGYLHETEDLMPAFSAVTHRALTVTDPQSFPQILGEAIATARGGRPGPVLLEIPMDVIGGPCDFEPVVMSPHRPPAEDDQVAEAALLLGLAARPVIWAGGGVIRSGASAQLVRLAELLGAPVVTTFMGKGAIPEDHPLCVGTMVRQPETIKMVESADLMLAIGTRFSGMSTGNWSLRPPAQLIHIDIDPDEIGRNYPVRLGVAADAAVALPQIITATEQQLDVSRASRDSDAAQARGAALERARSEGPDEMAVLDAIRRVLPPDVVTVHDMTIPSYWSVPFFEVNGPGLFHYPYGYASLGFSFPAALGVWAAYPDRPVVAFSGDGGAQYHIRELATAAESGARVTLIVFNDSRWGVLEAFATSRYDNDFGMAISGPDFIALARAYDIEAARASTPDELAAALAAAIDSPGPRVIEVPGKWALPPPASYYR